MTNHQKILVALYFGSLDTKQLAASVGTTYQDCYELKKMGFLNRDLLPLGYTRVAKWSLTLAGYIQAERDIQKLSRFKRLLLKIRRFAV